MFGNFHSYKFEPKFKYLTHPFPSSQYKPPGSRTLDEVLGAFGDGPMMKRLNVAGHSAQDYENFKNLILQMLEYDAKDRIRPLDALQHPFFKAGDLVESKNSTGSNQSVPRTPTAPATAVNQSNREFQTIQLAAMLNERSQLERSTLERSQLERIQSDEKADAFQYDLLQKYQKLYKSPGKQAPLSGGELAYRTAAVSGQLRGVDDLPVGQPPLQPQSSFPYFLYDTNTPDHHHQFVNALAQQRTNNGERLAFHLAAQQAAQPIALNPNPSHAGHFAAVSQFAVQMPEANLIDQKAAMLAGLAADDRADGKRSRFRKHNSSGSLINFSNSIGSNLNLADNSNCDLNSFAYVDAFSPSNGYVEQPASKFDCRFDSKTFANQFDQFDRFERSSNGRYAAQPFDSHYDKLRSFGEHYPSFKQSRLDQPYQTISSTISSLNLLDHDYSRDYSRCTNGTAGLRPVHRNKALSSSIGNLNLLNGQYRQPASHLSGFCGNEHAFGTGMFYENSKNSKRKSYANELYFK